MKTKQDINLRKSIRPVEMLRRLEWSGSNKGPPSAMHLNDGYPFPACPECSGICPESQWRGSWREEAVGHKRECLLNRALEQYS